MIVAQMQTRYITACRPGIFLQTVTDGEFKSTPLMKCVFHQAGNENERMGFMEKERGHKSTLAGEMMLHVRGSTISVMQSYPAFPQRVVRNCVTYSCVHTTALPSILPDLPSPKHIDAHNVITVTECITELIVVYAIPRSTCNERIDYLWCNLLITSQLDDL